jgi:uncharacterized protein (DUF2141 family)
MKKLSILLFIMALSSFKQQTNGTLTINTSDFNNDSGKAVIFLFRKDDKIPESPFKTVSTEIKDKKATFKIKNLDFDNYAIILLHDENGNGKIDHSMGLPSEQLGYSNNWKLGFFTGMPTFSKLKFQFSSSEQIENIKITFKKNKK